ncbi:hypothetical protein [Mucilaginibacter sp. SP1R1]|uniref:hypothetical protein n=1 Tax=Mucilaginibacter sp. SP1R1 TaxID=2723091 RepID=UPI0016073F33|nr:hypothetical protein [Mucilaginibacter sp. SP1R1]MBB6152353.1 hypothetical protein [Mucilaginibacter sp. SP1R1]
MDFPNLTDGFDRIKDELFNDAKDLGSDVIEGKTSPKDALNEGEGKIMDSLKSFFGSNDKTDDGSSNDADEDSDNDDKEDN